VVDPSNDLSFWTIQEYAAAPAGDPNADGTGRWSTWWARVDPPPPPPVRILQQPADQTVNAGSSVTFTVSATERGPLSYQWKRNGNPIRGATRPTLYIPSVQLVQAGNYSVDITGAAGTVSSRAARLTVTFANDHTPPNLSVSSPGNGQRFSSANITVRGTASDDFGLRGVFVRLNGNRWVKAEGGASWSLPLTLRAGRNVITISAADYNNNYRTITREVFYTVRPQVNLKVRGQGRIETTLGKSEPQVGEKYELRAIPDEGYVFSHWSGSVVSSKPVLEVVLEENFTADANFVPNPYPAYRGSYRGLVNGGQNIGVSGSIQLTMTGNGVYSGRLFLRNETLSFSGRFRQDLMSFVRLRRASGAALELQLRLPSPGGELRGQLAQENARAEIVGFRTDGQSVAPGSYRFTSPAAGGLNGPPINGRVTIAANGNFTVAGRTAAGESFERSGQVLQNGQIPFVVFTPENRGVLSVWLVVNDGGVRGHYLWNVGRQPGNPFYPQGLALNGEVLPVSGE
jgi:hypothetical protein